MSNLINDKVEKREVKISDLPLVSSLVGLSTIGVDAQNRTVRVGLEFIKASSDAALAAAERLNTLSDNPMKIINDFWYRYNELTGKYENTGMKAKGDPVPVVDSLISTSTVDALSANQGRALKSLVDTLRTDLNDYLPLSAGNGKPLTGKLYANGGVKLSVKGVSLTGVNSTGREEALIYISSTDDVVVGDQRDNLVLHSVASDLIHRRGASAEYKIWDAYNLSSPATTTDLNSYIPRSAQGVTTSLLNLQGGIYRGGASMDGEFGYACNMLLRFDSGGTNWYTGGILSISTGGELRVAGVSNGTLSVWRDVAMQGMSNNFLHSGNEVTFISQAAALPGVWLNYRGCAGGITDYLLGSGKADGSYANLKVKNLYTSESIYIPNGQKLKSYSSEGNIVDMAYVAPGSNILVLGHLSTPGVLIRSTNTDIYHARNVGGTATNYKIWDAYNLSSPVTGSGGVAGQLAKWSAATALSGGIAYSSGNVASTVVARDGNGAFAATSISVTNLNATNLGTGGNATTIHVGLIPRAVNTCYIGSADRPFAQMYSAHFNGHLAGSADFCCDKRVEVVTAIPSTTLANTVYFLT
ncbi:MULTISPECIES: hypothetical protein [Sanguibacteroides]|uniref:Uncharacterized protein n=1 Tax=Sanguibacteroides justesenii TaxID=1547597 RepID=A0AB34R3D4_9PORP|nr:MULTISPECIES: hypothetical protein [Sanguibacteroides]KIO45472.1 hypothetical protein IE90_08695 [Sanguibacteroides justesenii]